MGVHGLWRLIEPSGKPVPLETLENKVLAVDVSIWLHQAVKGFQDSRGASVPNAHLLGIYNRVCKLLYFKIKPIFVFDGGVPALKKQTIAKRTQSKLRNLSEADKIQRQLLDTLLKHAAVSKVLSEKIEASIGSLPKPISKKDKDNLYILPHNELDSTLSSSEEESYTEGSTSESSPSKSWDLHTIDMDSVHFKSLPVDVRHEILTDLKETRKQSSWGRLHELPKVSDDFSVYQMKRLLKRQAVQTALEEAEKEMGGKSLSLAELESILKDQGVITAPHIGKIIASDESTKYLLVKDVNKAIEEAKQKELEGSETNDQSEAVADSATGTASKADLEYEEDLKKAIAMSLECEPSTSNITDETFENKVADHKKVNPAEFSFLDNFTDADFVSSSSSEEEEETAVKLSQVAKTKLASAQSYMLEYSGLTPSVINSEINKIIGNNKKSVKVTKRAKLKSPTLSVVSESVEDVTSTVTDDSCKEDAVEIMSTTESSDSESEDVKAENSNVVVIDPNLELHEEDDLFADVFAVKSDSADTDQSNLITSSEPLLGTASITEATTPSIPAERKLLDEKNTEEQIAKFKTPTIELQAKVNEEPVPLPSSSSLFTTTLTSPIPAERKMLDEKETEEQITDKFKAPTIEMQAKVNEEPAPLPSRSSLLTTTPENKKVGIPKGPALGEKELNSLKEQLQKDKVDLITEGATKKRMAENITDQMYQEAQELLELFGVPYLVAPMEAEAQCAFLDAIDLTDGTITDDSDIWLFGGRTVYKNFFNQSKYVMEFKEENVKHHFKLTREQMVLLALLVGSDYTVGLQGVGPVTAMEILAAFPPSKGKVNEFKLSPADLLSGLREFRSWFMKGKSAGPGRSSLKSKLKNVTFTENFPSLQVVEAYLDPTVETSREAFSWGMPNATALIEFAREKFGWTKLKTEEVLNPVLKRLQEATHQKTIKDYFKTKFTVQSGELEKKMSKRVKTAITNMGKDPSEVLVEELQEDLKKQPRKKRVKKATSDTVAPEFSALESGATSTKSSRRKVKLDKLIVDKPETTSKSELDKTEEKPDSVSEKIDVIRRRRKLKDAKAGVDLKKPKLVKEKVTMEAVGAIPSELQHDEEVNFLSEVLVQSSQKVEDIDKELREKLKNIQGNALKKINTPQPSTSAARPISRPTRVPKKETIPQKARDETKLLRNKLKAIEVFRKGKQGPGYVPKRERKRRTPKDEAELSESSDD